jgi:hypothetical protein
MRNARVFISCGQRYDREIEIGREVGEYFKRKNFCTYLAERVHSSDALTENIFKFLKQSEYYVFIDFKRDQINKKCLQRKKNKQFRGSLFVNQELAIATFLRLEGIGFYEEGVQREGILDHHIYNAFPFKDVAEILKKLKKETKRWNKNSVNELKIIYNPASTTKGISLNIKQYNHQSFLSDWHHLEVRNRHRTKHAFSCTGYVTKITDLDNGHEYELPSNELIWSGTGDIMVNIMGGTPRDLDAFYIIYGENRIRFHERELKTTNPKYHLPSLSQGRYLIEYTVISSNFEKVSQQYILGFGGSAWNVRFRRADVGGAL